MQESITSRDLSTLPHPSRITMNNPAANPRRMRRIIAEDPEWTLAIVPLLTELCIQHIINNFEREGTAARAASRPCTEELESNSICQGASTKPWRRRVESPTTTTHLIQSMGTSPVLQDFSKIIANGSEITSSKKGNPILHSLLPEHQRKVLDKISTNLPLTVTANLISDENYWKRCCMERWTVCDVSHHGNSWKQMFFERHLENILKFYIPDTTSPNQVLDIIPLCKEYVKKLEIDQFLPPVKSDQKKDEEEVSDTESDAGIEEPSMDHFDMSMLIPSLCHLEELHLSYGVKDCGMNFEWNLFEFTYRDCFSLAKALKKCLTLKVFKLTRSKVDDDKARILIKHLLDHPSLTELDLSHNLIADRGARAVGKLINCSKLVTLNLCDNRIRASGAQAIAHALSKNSTLTSLNLRLNCIEDEGGQALCHALLVNCTVTTLHLGGNELSEPTATLFSQVLAQNTTLTHVNLSCNHIGLDGGKQLLEGMSDNKTVVEFDLRLAEVGQESEYLINQAIKTNQELARLRNLHPSNSNHGPPTPEEEKS